MVFWGVEGAEGEGGGDEEGGDLHDSVEEGGC